MSTNIRAFDTLNLADILIDDDAPLSTQRDANETYEDDFEHDISFTDQVIRDNENNEAPETEDEILAKYARAFEEGSQRSDDSTDQEMEVRIADASPRLPRPATESSAIDTTPTHEGTSSPMTYDTQHSASPTSSPAPESIQLLANLPHLSSSSAPQSRASYLKLPRPQISSGMFSKVRRIPKPIHHPTTPRRSKPFSPAVQPSRQLPDDLICEVYALHAKLEAAYAAPYASNARKINNAVPVTSQRMKTESYDKPMKEVSSAINDYDDSRHREASTTCASNATNDLSATRVCYEDSFAQPVHRPFPVCPPNKCSGSHDPITTGSESDFTSTANSIYATFLSDIISLAKERSVHANTVEELTMYRVLAQFLHKNFASHGAMERITADMIYAAKCNMK